LRAGILGQIDQTATATCRLDSFPVIQLAFWSTFTYECFSSVIFPRC
jgi:hypothetical protein